MLCRVELRQGEDGKKYVDIDECAKGTLQCEQECVNNRFWNSGHNIKECRSGAVMHVTQLR